MPVSNAEPGIRDQKGRQKALGWRCVCGNGCPLEEQGSAARVREHGGARQTGNGDAKRREKQTDICALASAPKTFVQICVRVGRGAHS
jgi:hypothetical protein